MGQEINNEEGHKKWDLFVCANNAELNQQSDLSIKTFNTRVSKINRGALPCCPDPIHAVPMTTPAGTQRRNDVVLTLMRRYDVALKSVRRYFDVMCLLGCFYVRINVRQFC